MSSSRAKHSSRAGAGLKQFFFFIISPSLHDTFQRFTIGGKEAGQDGRERQRRPGPAPLPQQPVQHHGDADPQRQVQEKERPVVGPVKGGGKPHDHPAAEAGRQGEEQAGPGLPPAEGPEDLQKNQTQDQERRRQGEVGLPGAIGRRVDIPVVRHGKAPGGPVGKGAPYRFRQELLEVPKDKAPGQGQERQQPGREVFPVHPHRQQQQETEERPDHRLPGDHHGRRGGEAPHCFFQETQGQVVRDAEDIIGGRLVGVPRGRQQQRQGQDGRPVRDPYIFRDTGLPEQAPGDKKRIYGNRNGP